MIIDAGEPGRDVRSDPRDDGWIAGEFVAPAAGRIDESGFRHRDVSLAMWRLGCWSHEADH